jgi:hypothetical protein
MYPTHIAYFRNYIRIYNGFSHNGVHITTSTLTTVYWYEALIKIWNIKIVKLNKNISHICLPVHSTIWLVPIVSCCFTFSAFGLNTKKKIGGTLKLLNFLLWYTRMNFKNPWYRVSVNSSHSMWCKVTTYHIYGS